MTIVRSMVGLGDSDRLPKLLPPRLAHVRERRHVRCVVPLGVPVFVSLYPTTRARKLCRAVALDLSVGGMAVEVIERNSLGSPNLGEDVVVTIDLDGSRVEILANVLSASPRKLRLRFIGDQQRQAHPGLLLVMTDLVTRSMEAVDRARAAALLENQLGFEHFVGTEHLDVRVQPSARAGVAPWWQIVLLDYVMTWTERDGLVTRAIGTPESLGEALVAPERATMEAVALRVAERGAAALPERATAFGFIAATLRR